MGLEKQRENKIFDTGPIYLFQKIIAQANRVNGLPLLSTIYKKIEECVGDDDYDHETDIMTDNWNESKIKLLGGTEIELVYYKRCILHGFCGLIKDNYLKHQGQILSDLSSIEPTYNSTSHSLSRIPSRLCPIIIRILMNYYRFSYNILRLRLIRKKAHSCIAII